MQIPFRAVVSISALIGTCICSAAEPLKLAIIDGQNNHDWKRTTPVLKSAFDKSGRFSVDVWTTPPSKSPSADWDQFRPKFSDYAVIVSNYNGELWPDLIQKNLEEYVANGGGLVIVHAANNAFPQWAEFNKMIGLGWRDNTFGDRITIDAEGKTIRTAKGEGPGAGHGSQHEFNVVIREPNHPVMVGLPREWRHARDELYHGQRGPAANMTILATAYADTTTGGTGDHEPMMWWIPYGKGKVFTTLMGHGDYSMKCVGFQTTLLRGAEWVATGEVTMPVPVKFPSADEASSVE